MTTRHPAVHPPFARTLAAALAAAACCAAIAATPPAAAQAGSAPGPAPETATTLTPTPTAKNVLRVGMSHLLFAGADPGDAKITLDHLLGSVHIGSRQYTSRLFQDTGKFFDAIRNSEIDFFPIMTPHFLTLSDDIEIAPAMATAFYGTDDPRLTLLLLAHKDKAGQPLSAFSNSEIVVDTGGNSTIPGMWLDTLLHDAGLPLRKPFFKAVREVTEPTKAAFPVFFRTAGLCITDRASLNTLAELNPQLTERLHIVAQSDPLLPFVMCFRKEFDPAAREQIVREITTIHETVQGRQILMLTKSGRMVRHQPEWMDGIRQLWEKHRALSRPQSATAAQLSDTSTSPSPPVLAIP